jgi:outer membrane protein TolC
MSTGRAQCARPSHRSHQLEKIAGSERHQHSLLRNQTLPDVTANFNYGLQGLGGTQLQRGLGPFGPGTGDVIGQSQRGYTSVLGDLFRNTYPSWTASLNISYPIGMSQAEASLARVRLQRNQSETQIKNQELQVVTQVRQAARQVQTNQQRVQTTQVSRQLAERRLEAEQRKFTAGTSTSFVVFQAQRDLAQARNNELRAILDYARSAVDSRDRPGDPGRRRGRRQRVTTAAVINR